MPAQANDGVVAAVKVRIINALMFSLLNGDVAALDKQFTISGTTTTEQWALDMKPKQAAFAKLIRSIALKPSTERTATRLGSASATRSAFRRP